MPLDVRVEGSLPSPPFLLDPFRDRSSRQRPASTGKPIFGAGRSTSLTDECQANIDSPRGNWGTRCTREPLCNVRRDQWARRWPDYGLVRLFFLLSPRRFLHINAIRLLRQPLPRYLMLRDKREPESPLLLPRHGKKFHGRGWSFPFTWIIDIIEMHIDAKKLNENIWNISVEWNLLSIRKIEDPSKRKYF